MLMEFLAKSIRNCYNFVQGLTHKTPKLLSAQEFSDLKTRHCVREDIVRRFEEEDPRSSHVRQPQIMQDTQCVLHGVNLAERNLPEFHNIIDSRRERQRRWQQRKEQAWRERRSTTDQIRPRPNHQIITDDEARKNNNNNIFFQRLDVTKIFDQFKSYMDPSRRSTSSTPLRGGGRGGGYPLLRMTPAHR